MPAILIQGHLNVFTRLVYLLDPQQKYIIGSMAENSEWILVSCTVVSVNINTKSTTSIFYFNYLKLNKTLK